MIWLSSCFLVGFIAGLILDIREEEKTMTIFMIIIFLEIVIGLIILF